MLVGLKKLLHFPVFTKSGVKLGKITDADFDMETQSVIKYHAAASAFSGNKFLIDRSQVLEITADKIVVDDSLAAEQNTEAAGQSAPQTALSTMAQSTINQE
jgi:sporulation protein YlmC with PRC-barrel domain